LDKKIRSLQYGELEKLLEGIERPGRYVGNEAGISSKGPGWLADMGRGVLVCLAFPDIYEVGMPNLGLQILYDIINGYPCFSAERAYAPWIDFEERLRRTKTALFSLENRIFLDSFDLIGFSLQHELLYTNTLNMLDIGGIEVISGKRGPDAPLVCAGGPAVVNPGPMSRFMDFMVVGDGEEIIIELLKLLQKHKYGDGNKGAFLKDIAKLDGVYVPSEYRFFFYNDGKIKKIEPPLKVKKAVIKDLDSFRIVTRPVIPGIKTVHDRYEVEIMRGCPRGCRFCQAGYIYRPVRKRKAEKLVEQSIEGLANTGYEEISFLSLSASDYSELDSLLKGILEEMKGKNLSISLPSLRLDSFSIGIAELINQGRRPGLTFAPEAGSQRMRDIIKKNITERQIMECIDIAFGSGWEKIKLYFMIGLPGEKEEDILEIAELIKRIAWRARKAMPRSKLKRFYINVSINVFIPKPFTPFQWTAQDAPEKFEEKIHLILKNISARYINISWSNPDISRIECALSRGDIRMGKAIEDAWKKGARFDNWNELFNRDAWIDSFKINKIPVEFFTSRKYDTGEILPWDIVDIGIKKRIFLAGYNKALELINIDSQIK
jgi:radical SAM family uncharacterized protein